MVRSPTVSPRFIADCMLGRLAKWLRVLGYDVAYDRRIADEDLIRRAWREDRILLTRDRALLGRRELRRLGVGHLLVESVSPEAQLVQAVRHHGLRLDAGRFLSRCLRCNEPTEPAGREEVKDGVPPYVLRTQRRFSRCPACRRVYWRATHVDGILRRLPAGLRGDPP